MIASKRVQGHLVLGSAEVELRWSLPRLIARTPLPRTLLRSLHNCSRDQIRRALEFSSTLFESNGRARTFALADHVLKNTFQFNPVAVGWRTAA